MDLRLMRAAPVDRVLAAFNLAMATAWSLVLGRVSGAAWLCLAHLGAAALPLLIERVRRPARFTVLLRCSYPLPWLAVFWTEIDSLRRALHASAHDPFIRLLDVSLFGRALHSVFMPTFSTLWVSEPLHFAYFAYYAAIGVPLLALAVQRRFPDLGEAYLRLMLTYTVCFTLFALFPVDGPHHLEPIFSGRPADGLWYRVVHAVNERGGSLGAAFPSSHAAGAVTIAFIGWRFFRRRIALLITVHAGMVVLATFYTQYHYAIDSFAGVALAVVLQTWIAPLLLGPRRASVPVPRLPVMPRYALGIERPGGRS